VLIVIGGDEVLAKECWCDSEIAREARRIGGKRGNRARDLTFDGEIGREEGRKAGGGWRGEGGGAGGRESTCSS